MSLFAADIADYLRRPKGNFSTRVDETTSQEWEELGRNKALDLFRDVAARVPAYRDFLREHGIKPNDVRTYDDFSRVPPTDKENYIDRHELSQLMWDGNISQATLFNTSLYRSHKLTRLCSVK